MTVLGTLGSDKSVTPLNAIMTEIFTGLKPTKIKIYRETPPIKQNVTSSIEKALNYLGLKTEVTEEIVGEGVKVWRERMGSVNVDVFDVTPGRKYMAYIAANYSSSNEVRYIYIRNENEGYKVFGYIPFNNITVFDLRTGNEIKIDKPPLTNDKEPSLLDAESLTALVNILKLHGDDKDSVKIKIGDRDVDEIEDDFIKLCETRSGKITYREEDELRKLMQQDYFFLADTNVYINLGNRLKKLLYDKNKGLTLLASISTYRELKDKLNSTQKTEELIRFRLGMLTFKNIHWSVISQLEDKGKFGDVKIKEEVRMVKSVIPNNVALITGDRGIVISSTDFKTISLRNTRRLDQFDVGEFLLCLSFSDVYYKFKKEVGDRNLYIELNGKNVTKLTFDTDNEKVLVTPLDGKYNYGKVLEVLSEAIH